ncbi:MAG: zinc ribbon domain-containing protein [Anaerolineae bacterium]
MPLYEYYCADCQTRFEALRPISKADAQIQCRECESIKTSRVPSVVAAYTGGSARSSEPGLNVGGCCGGRGGCACSVS